jgi:hypothetical protein
MKKAHPSIHIEILTGIDLVYNTKLALSQNEGKTKFTIHLKNKQTISSEEIELVINRLAFIPIDEEKNSKTSYHEWLAIYNILLYSIQDRIINSPDLFSFLGHTFQGIELKSYLIQSGLTVADDFINYPLLPKHDKRIHYLMNKSTVEHKPTLHSKLIKFSSKIRCSNFELSYQYNKGEIVITGFSMLPAIPTDLGFYHDSIYPKSNLKLHSLPV